MPTSARRLASAFPSSGNSVPSTEIVPDWMVSSRLIARQSVDLPEPEGPRTTTTSPERIVMLIFCKTCRSPKYLSTSDSTTNGAPTWPATGEAAALAESSMGLRLDDLGGECRDLVLRFGYVFGCRAAVFIRLSAADSPGEAQNFNGLQQQQIVVRGARIEGIWS